MTEKMNTSASGNTEQKAFLRVGICEKREAAECRLGIANLAWHKFS